MRDPGVIDALDALGRYARSFDEISHEQDAPTRAQFRPLGEAGDGSARYQARRVRCAARDGGSGLIAC